MICSKPLSVTVDSDEPCCLSNTADIAVGGLIANCCYAITDNRIVAISGTNTLIFINAATDTIVGTVPGFGSNPAYLTYSPVNNRVYCVDFLNGNMLEINPTLMTHISTTPPPFVGLTIQQPCYDSTNDLIYAPAWETIGTTIYILRFNPQTLVFDFIYTAPSSPPEVWGKLGVHCVSNNRIYIPFFNVATNDTNVRVFSVAGVQQAEILFPATNGSLNEAQVYYDANNDVLYFLCDSLFGAGLPGVAVIEPSDNSIITTMALSDVLGAGGFLPECQSFHVLTVDGNFRQFNTSDYSVICTTSTGIPGLNVLIQITASLSKVYLPNTLGNQLLVMTPP